MDIHFDLPKEQSSIIKVLGIGGGGSNAVNHMFQEGIRGVNYIVCNTDAQALDISAIPNKIQLGPEITQGLGAGSRPEVGANATLESSEDIKDILSKNTRMVFITAGMGGGTGTGGAPVVAKLAKEMGILTVGIVTTPFSFEGRRKLKQADEGIQELKQHVDSIIVISNDKIREMFGNLSKSEAFARADNILASAARSISEIITVPGQINVDFADVEYVMKDSGVSIMGCAEAEGEDRAMRAVHAALNSPLLNDSNITGAKHILINITSGKDQVTIDEITSINDFVQDAAGNDTDIIFGTCDDNTLGDKLSVTIIATGFQSLLEKDDQEKQCEVIELESTVPQKDDDAMFLKKVDTPSSNEAHDVDETSTSDTLDLFSSKEEENPETEDESLQFEVREETENTQSDYGFYVSSQKEQKKQEEKTEEASSDIDDRKRRLRDVSFKWNNMSNLNEMENQPAYMRRGVDLDDVPHSSQSEVSRFTLDSFNVHGEARPEIRKNNSFLNDNVD